MSTIEKVIEPLGLVQRALKLKTLGRAVADLGGVPRDPRDLLKLSAIGPYGAHAIPVFAYGEDLPVVDWVIAQVLRRYFGLSSLARPNTDADLWGLAANLARLGSSRSLWLGTLNLAAEICAPSPKCERCPLSPTCRFVSLGPESTAC